MVNIETSYIVIVLRYVKSSTNTWTKIQRKKIEKGLQVGERKKIIIVSLYSMLNNTSSNLGYTHIHQEKKKCFILKWQ